jgi:mono/diheme cytochrome c family protein
MRDHDDQREKRMNYLWITCAVAAVILVSTHSEVQSGETGSPLVTQSTRSESGTRPPTGNSKRGEELYQASCVVCHGSQAAGAIGPKLAGNPVLANDKAFWKVVHEGRHVMPPLNDVLSDQQLADIRAWLQTLP